MGFFSSILPIAGTVLGGMIGGPAGAAIGGSLGGAIGGGLAGSQAAGAATQAGNIQAQATQQGIAEQRRQFDVTQANLAPFQQAGVSALGQQQAMLGMGGAQEQQQAFDAFSDSPGQQFLRDQQERALVRNASKIGGLGGGNVRTALQQQAFGRAQTDFGNQFNRLGAIRSGGQAATTNLGQFGQQTGANVSNLMQTGAQARASGLLGAQQQRAIGGQQIASALGGIDYGSIFGGGGISGSAQTAGTDFFRRF